MDDFFERLDGLYRKGDLTETERYLKDCLAKLETTGEKLMKISVLNELGGLYRGISRYRESADCYGEALDILKKRNLRETPQYATVLMNYAGTCRLSGRVDEAVSLFLSAKKLLEDAGRSSSYEYGSTLNNLAIAYQDLGEMEKADDMAAESLALMRSMDAAGQEVVTALNNLASVRLAAGKTESAEALAREALSMFEAEAAESVHHAAVFSTLGAIYFRQGKYDRSADSFEKSLSLTHKYFGKNIEYAVTLHNIAVAYKLMGDAGTAVRFQRDALDLMIRLVGESDIRTIAYRRTLDELNREFDKEL